MAMKKHAVIFDMDGVLVDTEPVINRAAILGLAEFGVKANPEDFIPFIGRGEVKYIGGVAEKYGVRYQPEMKDRVYEIYFDLLKSMLKPKPGAKETLQKLHELDYRLALASSADRKKIDANLEAAEIPHTLFNVILAAEDVQHKKPAPDIYLKAAELLGWPAKNCVVIEDALNGIQAAKAAGMRCIALSGTFTREELRAEGPDFICNDFAEILELIGREFD